MELLISVTHIEMYTSCEEDYQTKAMYSMGGGAWILIGIVHCNVQHVLQYAIKLFISF